MRKIFLFSLLVIFITYFDTHSQVQPNLQTSEGYKPLSGSEEVLRQRFGIYAGLNLNMHRANFKKLPDCPNCSPGYETGFGSGLNIGLLYEYPLSNFFLLGFRAGYSDNSGLLKKTEPTTVIVNGNYQPGEFEHRLDAGLASINFGPTISYKLYEKLFVSTGLNLGLVTKYTFSQSEKISKPASTGTFLDAEGNDSHKRIRNVFSGNIPGINKVSLNGIVGLSYELPLNESGSLFAAPEVNYSLGFLNVEKSTEVKKWKVNPFGAIIAVKYSPLPEVILTDSIEYHEKIDTVQVVAGCKDTKKVIPGIPRTASDSKEKGSYRITTNKYQRIDTLVVPRKLDYIADVSAVGIDSAGKEMLNPTIKIEEFYSSRLQPLLHYIFFDENSSEINKKYTMNTAEQTSSFNENKLFYKSTLETYYEILNIVGKRMKEFPKAKLRIVGCNDGYSSEKNNSGLSGQRAEAVKKYLINIWKIPESNLIVEASDPPQKASKPISEPDKTQENRRVELYCDNYEILKPVFASDTIRTSNPPVIRFKPYIKPLGAANDYNIEVSQNNKPLKMISKTGADYIDWNIGDDQASVPRFEQPVGYSLIVEDSCGDIKKTNSKNIQIKQFTISKKKTERIADREIDKYSMILFDFDKETIDGSNKKIIEFIASRIKPESEIEICGYTDRTGDDEYNKKLSGRRALATGAALKRKDANAIGIGEDKLLYDNNIPEGRFYCRTVDITVKTKKSDVK